MNRSNRKDEHSIYQPHLIRVLCVALLVLLLPATAAAYNKSWDQGHNVCVSEDGKTNWGKFDDSGVFHGGYTSKDCCEKYCKVCPVYANTGQLQQSFTDLSVAGVGPALLIKRTYNSQDWASSFLGQGWTFNFGKRLIIARNSDDEKIIGLLLETGEKNYYREHDDGTLERLTGYGADFELVKNADGRYSIRELGGGRTELDATGKIQQIIDRNGNALSFQYNAVGCVSRITNASGNHIDFTLGPNGKIASATDNFGRSIGYTYDERGNLIAVTDPLGNSVQYGYNSDNLLTQRTNARGDVIETIAYDSHQPPRVASFVEKGETFTVQYFPDRTEKSDSQGNTWTYYYNDVGVITRTVDPLGNETEQQLNKLTATSVDWEEDANGNRTSYTYDALGNVASSTDALGNTWTYTYVAGTDWLETETNPLGGVTTYVYDADGNETTVIRESGGTLENTTAYTYDGQGNQTSVTDPLGNTTAYEYDGRGNMIKVTDALGHVSTYTYDARGNRLTETDANGNTTSYTFDQQDRQLTMTDALGNVTTYAYDADGNRTSRTEANGNTSTSAYDAYDRLTQETDALGNSTTRAYDERDNLISATDANGNTKTYTYDILDRLTKETDALGGETTRAYDPAGNLLSLTDANGKTTSFTYDANNRQLSKTNAAGETTSYSFDADGRLVASAYPNGNTTSNLYDALDRVTSSSDSLGLLRSFAYDGADRLISETDALGNTVSFTLDALGRIITTTDALGNPASIIYDPVGNVTASTDREGNTTSHVFDALNRKVAETDALGNVTAFAYDPVGNLLSITDANGNQTSYDYDARNRLTRETYADGTVRTFAYDAAGNRIARTDQNGDTTVYIYDGNNRLTSIAYPDGNDSVFGYDALGNLLTADNDNGTITRTYDDAYRMTQSVQNGQTVIYAYDIPNRTKTIIYPSGKTVMRIKNLRNLLTVIEDASSQALVQYTYDAANRLQTRQYLNSVSASYSYNPNGWITDLVYSGAAGQLLGYEYGFDAEGNRQYAKSLLNGSSSEQYTYDGKYRLTQFARGVLDIDDQIPAPSTQTSYDLDALANWRSKTTDGVTRKRAHNEMNELVDINGVLHSYDSNGNLIEDGVNTYQYDYENRLVRVVRKSNGLILGDYKYDALSRRIEKQASGKVIAYFYDENQVVEEQVGGMAEATYIFGSGLDQVEIMDRRGATYFYHANSTGSTVGLTDFSGNIVESYSYDPFGSIYALSAIGNPYLFTGRRFMAEVGIYYYRARTYDPSSGRFLQRDPLGYVDGFNLYEYANSNPINMSDPYGLKAEEDCDESCGPDVTRWLANQMILNKDHPVIRASRENVWADFVPFFNLGWNYGFFTDFRDLVKAGGPWDFKASQSFKSQSCPSSNCNSTVTMCGSCLDYDVPGNIHYGWVGVAARIRPWFLHNRAAAAQAGGVDDPADTVAIDIGISLWQQGGGSLCSLVNRYKSGLRKGSKDCQVCREAY